MSTTTTNPSLAVDNDAERREKAFGNVKVALADLGYVLGMQLMTLEAENARLRAALTEAEETLAWELPLETKEAQRALAESERARAILARQLDEEVARLPRLRQEQTAEIERLRSALADERETSDLALKYRNECLDRAHKAEARIAELEAEVERLKAPMPRTYAVPALPIDKDDEAEIDAAVKRSREPAPAAPAVPVIEVGSRWCENATGDRATVTEVDEEAVGHRFDHGFCDRLYRRAFRDQFTRLPDEAKPAVKP